VAVDLIAAKIEQTFPSLRVDKVVLRQSLVSLKSSPQHFYRERGNNVLAAQTDNLPFSTRKQCALTIWIGSGEGVVMFREWMTWIKSRKAIRLATVTPLFEDARLGKILARFGFRRVGAVFIWERGTNGKSI